MMAMGGMKPADQIKKVADDLKESAERNGVDAAEQLVDALEDVKEMAKKGPGDVVDKVKGMIKELMDKLSAAANDPSSIGGAGPVAACASWYGQQVCNKLKSLAEEIEEMVKGFGSIDIKGQFKEVGDVMNDAMKGLNQIVKGLTKLPKDVMGFADAAKGGDDEIAKVDTAPMKKAVDVSGLSGPLDALSGLKGSLGPAIKGVKAALAKLEEFLMSAPDMVRNAFGVPQPLCFLTPMLMSNAPPLMAELLEKLDSLKSLDFAPFMKGLKKMADMIGDLDVAAVKGPIEKFAGEAKDKVGDLDKVVAAAKLSSDPAGAMKGAMGGLPGGMPGF